MTVALLAGLAAMACKSDVIVDDWGPPAGYARITGRVTSTSGAPISSAEVLVSRCSPPVDGVLGQARTSADGTYRLTGALPPIGLFPALADTVRTRCAVFVERRPEPVDSLEVRFASDTLAVPPQLLDLVIE